MQLFVAELNWEAKRRSGSYLDFVEVPWVEVSRVSLASGNEQSRGSGGLLVNLYTPPSPESGHIDNARVQDSILLKPSSLSIFLWILALW